MKYKPPLNPARPPVNKRECESCRSREATFTCLWGVVPMELCKECAYRHDLRLGHRILPRESK